MTDPLDRRRASDGFDVAASRYDLMVALNPGYRRHLRRAAEALVAGVTVPEPVLLDLGCGSGLSTRELHRAAERRGLRARVIGVDASAGMLAKARQRDWPTDVTFVEGRAEELPSLGLPAADGALACYLLRNVTDLAGTLTGIRAALRPGAPFVAEDYSVRGSSSAQRRWGLVNRHIIVPLARTVGGGDVALYEYLHRTVDDFATMPELAHAFTRNGFSDVASRTVDGWQRDILHLMRARAGNAGETAVPGQGARKAVRSGEPTARLQQQGKVWTIGSVQAARQVLRARHQTTQAGFTAERIPQGGFRHRPILISDGPAHDEQRKKVARFFAPVVVRERYAGLMADCAERHLASLRAGEEAALDDIALHFAVEVTAEVVGLTTSRPGEDERRRQRRIRAMSRRLVSFFNQPPFDLSRDDLGRTPQQWAVAAVNGLVPVARFFAADVLPAVRQRRREPSDDVLSHLIREGYSLAGILVECVTYGTAGMVTTREFICMAAWHLLDDDALRRRYLDAEQEERLAMLAEVLRLEPVVGHLYRRVTEPFEVCDSGTTWTIPAGDLVDVHVRLANADPQAVGEEPLRLCPQRKLPAGLDPTVLTFGDGAHRCPGQPLAMLEADAFLTRLLALDVELVAAPRLGWDDLIAGYWLRDFRVRARRHRTAC